MRINQTTAFMATTATAVAFAYTATVVDHASPCGHHRQQSTPISVAPGSPVGF